MDSAPINIGVTHFVDPVGNDPTTLPIINRDAPASELNLVSISKLMDKLMDFNPAFPAF